MAVVLSPLRVSLPGIDFNTQDDDGVIWGMDDFPGWGSPATTLSLTQKSRQPGGYRDSPPQLAPRTLPMSGQVFAPTTALAVAAKDALSALITLDESQLTVIEGDTTRYCNAARDDEVACDWLDSRSFAWSTTMVASDPRKYGDPIVISTGLPTSTGGLTWPVTWPIEWTGVSASGIIHIDNPGNTSSPVIARIDGPVVGPLIRHDSTGTELVLSSSYTLNAGSWLDIDTGSREVDENGTASRNGFIVSRGWFTLDEGANDFIFGNSGAYSAGALLTITATPAWL